MAIASLPVIASGEETAKKSEPPRNVLVRVEWIEVGHETLTELMGDRSLVQDGTKLRRRLQELVRAEKAVVFETAMVTARAGSKAKIGSAREWINATEFEPMAMRTATGGIVGGGPPGHPDVPPIPTAFETVEAGSLLDVEPTLSDDRRVVKLSWATGLRSLKAINSYAKRRTPGGNEFDIVMPEFAVTEPQGELAVRDGNSVLAAVVQRDPAADARLLVMIRCDVLRP